MKTLASAPPALPAVAPPAGAGASFCSAPSAPASTPACGTCAEPSALAHSPPPVSPPPSAWGAGAGASSPSPPPPLSPCSGDRSNPSDDASDPAISMRWCGRLQSGLPDPVTATCCTRLACRHASCTPVMQGSAPRGDLSWSSAHAAVDSPPATRRGTALTAYEGSAPYFPSFIWMG